MVGRDLLGPWGGEFEEFPPRALGPRERYLVGMLGPKPSDAAATPGVIAATSVADTDTASYGDGEADLPEIITPQSRGRIWASSMGLSFAVTGDGPSQVDVVVVTAEWGQYRDARSRTPTGAR